MHSSKLPTTCVEILDPPDTDWDTFPWPVDGWVWDQDDDRWIDLDRRLPPPTESSPW